MPEEEQFNGGVYYVNFPDYSNKVRGGFGSGAIGQAIDKTIDSVGLGNSTVPLGHAGIATVDKNGNTRYYEYGRYPNANVGVKIQEKWNWNRSSIPNVRVTGGKAAGVLGVFTGVPQALFAGYDAFTNGVNTQNATDMLKIIPGGALMKKLGLKWTNSLIGKYKNPRHFNLSKTSTENMSITEAFKNDPRRLIYHVPGKLWDGLGIANDIFHIENNK